MKHKQHSLTWAAAFPACPQEQEPPLSIGTHFGLNTTFFLVYCLKDCPAQPCSSRNRNTKVFVTPQLMREWLSLGQQHGETGLKEGRGLSSTWALLGH